MMLTTFMSGTNMTLYFVASLLFAKFWSRTHDRLFLGFSCSFALLGVERVATLIMGLNDETQSWVYLIRFFAFVLLVLAIVDKNRSSSRS